MATTISGDYLAYAELEQRRRAHARAREHGGGVADLDGDERADRGPRRSSRRTG